MRDRRALISLALTLGGGGLSFANLVMDIEFPLEMGFEFLLARGIDSPMTDYDDGQVKNHQTPNSNLVNLQTLLVA